MSIDEAEIKDLKWNAIWLSIKNYIASRPPIFLGYDNYGLGLQRSYNLSDFMSEFGVKKTTINNWKKSGNIAKRYERLLISKNVLPKDWGLLK